ncbi:MAG TPA: hypothetical protein PK279_15775, partial [Accumulibacter sp.]|nr:hypothetical protein [Accumulibacter sp.]
RRTALQLALRISRLMATHLPRIPRIPRNPLSSLPLSSARADVWRWRRAGRNRFRKLTCFRQGAGFARGSGSGTRPGGSFWPEANAVRHLTGGCATRTDARCRRRRRRLAEQALADWQRQVDDALDIFAACQS